MAKIDKPRQTFLQKMNKLKRAGISSNHPISTSINDPSPITDISERVRQIIGLINTPNKNRYSMTFFVMYDIENNKVRYQIAKYLERKSCIRVQRSIFLADLSSDVYNEIKADLAEVQSLYDNHDSILIVPISSDYLQAMKIIGQSIDVDIITKTKNTLFF